MIWQNYAYVICRRYRLSNNKIKIFKMEDLRNLSRILLCSQEQAGQAFHFR